MARSDEHAAGQKYPDRTGWRRYAPARVVDVLFRSALLGMAALSLVIIVCGYGLGYDSWLPGLIFVGALLAIFGIALLAAQWLILSEYRWTVRISVSRPWYRYVAWIAVLLFAWAFGTWGAAHGVVQGAWALVPSTLAAIGTVIAGLAAWRGANRAGTGNRARPPGGVAGNPDVQPDPELIRRLSETLRQRPTQDPDVLLRTPAAVDLENLAALLDNGIISWSEFRELKASLLTSERLARIAEDNLWAEFEEFLRDRQRLDE